MSQQLFVDDTRFLQRLLSCAGFYSDTIDGLWGPNTDAAEQAFFDISDEIAGELGSFDKRSEGNIRTLLPGAQRAARASLARIRNGGHDARIISGTRSYAEQNRLFKQGRFGNPGNIVTNARGGQSWHNFGRAWDIGLFVDGTYQTKSTPYAAVAPLAKGTDLEWGGDWTSFKDMPHYQWQTSGKKISAARAAFEAGCR